ncbi:MAG: inosine/xanthosine triphosphatase [Candidatus Abawacabacteria bacterium]|nr:inosine/xanthosine triphosphatase [Candidatus Abawacabacteria bacterium]
MRKVIIASQNPVKVKAAELGFQKMFPGEEFLFEGVATISGVSDQPKSEDEAFQGARNRANNASTLQPEADFWVGQESGIDTFQTEMVAFGWVVIKSRIGLWGKGRTGTFFLPSAIVALIKEGKDLGQADDIVFGRTNSPKHNGAVGLLTGDVIDRTAYYTAAMIMALIPFKNPHLYS